MTTNTFPTRLAPQYPYEIKWLPVGAIKPHPNIQRRFVPGNAKRLLATWDSDQMGELEVVPNGARDNYHCFEGQHRLWAVFRYLGEDPAQLVPCRVYGQLPEKVLAGFRLARDSQLGQVPVDRFGLKVKAEYPLALSVKAILQNFGLRVAQEPGDGVVQAVVACERAVARPGGIQDFQRTIKLLHAAFGKAKEGYHAVLITAVNNMIRQYGNDLDDKRMIAALQSPPGRTGNNPASVSIVAGARAMGREMDYTTTHAAAIILTRSYNKIRGKKLPPWGEW